MFLTKKKILKNILHNNKPKIDPCGMAITKRDVYLLVHCLELVKQFSIKDNRFHLDAISCNLCNKKVIWHTIISFQ